MNKAQKSALPPGSPEAVEHGCRCNAMDNAFGKGAGTGPSGGPIFIYRIECPLHRHLVPPELAT